MRRENGLCYFGLFKGMVYSKCDEDISDYYALRNTVSKDDVIRHMETLDDAITSIHAVDIFTGEDIGNAGFVDDGMFCFPVDFIHYYKRYDIGIPYEYETYLIQECGLKPKS